MSDARALLAAERASRRITHPNASYTGDGKLRCNICETIVKSDAAWQAHLHSTGHTLRTSQKVEAAASRGSVPAPAMASKKRKAFDISSEASDERKKLKPDDEEDARANAGNAEDADKLAGLAAMARGENAPPPVPTLQSGPDSQVQSLETAQSQLLGRTFDGIEGVLAAPQRQQQASHSNDDVDVVDSELRAFERELAELDRRAPASALKAHATISAAPMTAEEIAAQAREEQSAQRGKRDVEIEAETEEAASALREEFEEMEGLEERLRKLREKREALRKKGNGEASEGPLAVDIDEKSGQTRASAGEDDEDDDEEYDDWGFSAG
ncbi:hypothetical protein B0A55_11062 [Friedmanniomyces simplex]|uniref:Coiled-coil domain-containing protein 16 n=1 Tax=Friedmanniomyces simplex TaxID=329884 RepID=A0A4U0WN95_9PEZI|nr:hypothetical protein B0A55_11062 [Friedmanniomyces simplex]